MRSCRFGYSKPAPQDGFGAAAHGYSDAQKQLHGLRAEIEEVERRTDSWIDSKLQKLRELSPEQVQNQIETLLFGPLNVICAVLPVTRRQRAGLLIISSTDGLLGLLFCSAYSAAKFGVVLAKLPIMAALPEFSGS